MRTPTTAQMEICRSYGVEPLVPDVEQKLGIALQTLGRVPLHGLRHIPEHGTCGWYIWAGEGPGTDPDFFQPLHIRHIENYCPDCTEFLALPPGWRYLKAGTYLDVWFDSDLLIPD